VKIKIISVVAGHGLDDFLRGLGPPLFVHDEKKSKRKKKWRVEEEEKGASITSGKDFYTYYGAYRSRLASLL
jgi:hypothetical protein